MVKDNIFYPERTMTYFILYCKGWFKRIDNSKDIWNDLDRIFTLDGYGLGYEYPRTKREILHVALDNFEEMNDFIREYYPSYTMTCTKFVCEIDKHHDLKCDYLKAVLLTIFYYFRFLKIKDLIHLEVPNFDEKLTEAGFVKNEFGF